MKIIKEVYHLEQKREGQEKVFKTKVGVVLQRDSGSLVMKLNYLPLTTSDVWLELYNPYTKDPLLEKPQPKIEKKTEKESDDMPF